MAANISVCANLDFKGLTAKPGKKEGSKMTVLSNNVNDDISPHCMFRSLTPLPSPLSPLSSTLAPISLVNFVSFSTSFIKSKGDFSSVKW